MHRIPVGRAGVGPLLALTPRCFLGRDELRQQGFHGGRQVVGVGPGLRHQGFVEREVDRPLAGQGRIGGISIPFVRI
jgi:hypothetical protein